MASTSDRLAAHFSRSRWRDGRRSDKADCGEKLVVYARAGVRQCIILNLRNRTAEVYTNPDAAAGTYPPPQVIAEGDSLALRVGEAEHFTLPLADMLP